MSYYVDPYKVLRRRLEDAERERDEQRTEKLEFEAAWREERSTADKLQAELAAERMAHWLTVWDAIGRFYFMADHAKWYSNDHRLQKERADKAEADAAAMREDLEETLGYVSGASGDYFKEKWDLGASLKVDAGRALLARLYALQGVVDAAREYWEQEDLASRMKLMSALIRLDAVDGSGT